MDIEKNDIDINRLFNWKTEYDIIDFDGGFIGKVWMRLPGDADINRAKVFALRESAELRRKLKDLDSDERLAMLPDIDMIEYDNLLMATLGLKIRSFTKDGMEKIVPPLPKEPKSTDSLEVQEEYQQLVDEYPAKRQEMITKYIEGRTEKEKTRLSNYSKENLYLEYIREAIDFLCETRMVTRYREMLVYLGTFKDSQYKERLFSSFDEFDNIRTSIKEQLMDTYMNIEMNMEELKK